jgi:hypothetical protein
MAPVRIAAAMAACRRRRAYRIAFEPSGDVEVIELLAPKQSRISLALDAARIFRESLLRSPTLEEGGGLCAP